MLSQISESLVPVRGANRIRLSFLPDMIDDHGEIVQSESTLVISLQGIPDAAHMLDEMRTGHKAVVQLAHPEDGWGREAINGTIEVVFEDGTRSPFCFSCAPSDFIDGRLPLKGKLERVVVSTDGQVNALTLPASSSLEVTHDACGNRTTTSNSVTVCDVGYVAIERKSVSGMGHCTCGKRISANKKSCFACMQAEGGNRVN